MTTVFIAGSMKIKTLDQKVRERLDKIIASDFSVIIGDADGVDSSIQEYLHQSNFNNILIYCTGREPRNNIGHWPVRSIESNHSPGSRAFYTAKDKEMAKAADYGLMIWDAKSTGTLSNIIELLSRKKKSLVFVNKMKDFMTISSASDLEDLMKNMSEIALKQADQKIGIKNKINSLKNSEHPQLF